MGPWSELGELRSRAGPGTGGSGLVLEAAWMLQDLADPSRLLFLISFFFILEFIFFY